MQSEIPAFQYEEAYCLFCRTGQEREMAAQINWRPGLRAIFPMKQKNERKAGRWQRVEKPLLPSYIFVYAAPQADVEPIKWLPGVVRILRYDDGSAAMRGTDRMFADWIWRTGGVVGISKAVWEGERVKVVEGPLKDLSGVIVAVDKRKQIAKIQLNVGGVKLIWLSYEYLAE